MVAGFSWFLTKNWVSWRFKGGDTVSVPYANYSPDMISKNKAIQESLVMSLSVEDHPWETDYMQWGAEIWRGRNQIGGGGVPLSDRPQTVGPRKS